MATFLITIDRSLCSGFGACADFAPDLVELGADGVAAARVGRSGRSPRPRPREHVPDGGHRRRRRRDRPRGGVTWMHATAPS